MPAAPLILAVASPICLEAGVRIAHGFYRLLRGNPGGRRAIARGHRRGSVTGSESLCVGGASASRWLVRRHMSQRQRNGRASGADTLVVCKLDGVDIQVTFNERHDFHPGQPIRLKPDLGLVHVFDVATERRL